MKKTNKNAGFSLVELIVVIAIMAILVAVLAPTLISKIEDSREATDISTIGEVRQAIVTALGTEAVNDELVGTSDQDVLVKTTLSDTAGVEISRTAKTAACKEMNEIIGSYSFKSKALKKDAVGIKVTVTSAGKPTVAVPVDKDNNEILGDDGKFKIEK